MSVPGLVAFGHDHGYEGGGGGAGGGEGGGAGVSGESARRARRARQALALVVRNVAERSDAAVPPSSGGRCSDFLFT